MGIRADVLLVELMPLRLREGLSWKKSLEPPSWKLVVVVVVVGGCCAFYGESAELTDGFGNEATWNAISSRNVFSI